MYGLQTAPSPRRTNCKIQRNIKYKVDNLGGGGGEILDENLYWNSHNNSHPHPYPYPHPYTLTLTLTPTLTLTLVVTLTLVLATPHHNCLMFVYKAVYT